VLRDPEPAALLALVAREAGALAGVPQGMLFFYYSGHADQGALYTAGKEVSIEALRAALDRPEVSLRVGVIDACQGGGWTRAKGLVPDAPFEVTLPSLLASEGSALISSSSGSEAAHESDQLRGSFFTHHFAAALRGAADDRHAGEVTLTEAFEYARQQTVRETARRAAEPQHPSFALNLKGRQDLVLAQLAQAPSALAVEQAEGPVELVHLGSGLRLLELPPGRRQVTLAVPPGSYLVRKVSPGGVLAREVVVPATGAARVAEQELVLVGAERLAVKGSAPVARSSWPQAGGGELALGVDTWEQTRVGHWGVGTGSPFGVGAMARFDGRCGLTDRLAWKIGTAALAYRLGDGEAEVALHGGLLAWKVALDEALEPNLGGFMRGASEARVGGGLGARLPNAAGAVVLTLEGDHVFIGREQGWTGQAALGFTLALGSAVRLHLAAAVRKVELPGFVVRSNTGGVLTEENFGGHMGYGLYFGSVQEFGLEPLPLVRISPAGTWALDLFASGGDYRQISFRLGVSRPF
jgi:hypothetical protein